MQLVESSIFVGLKRLRKIPDHKSLFKKPEGIGAAIGHLIWQNAVNYYFHDIDEWILSLGFRYERYVDDMYFVVDNKTSFLSYIMPLIRNRLENIGAKLNESKFYCQHYTKGCECLGTHIKMDRVYPNKRIIDRAIKKAKSFDRCVSVNKIGKLLSSINSYLGICKNINGYAQVWRIINALNPKWFEYIEFNRRRVCLQAKPKYKENKRIIHKFNLR